MVPNRFALTTLSQHPEYFEEVIALIEEEFHYSKQHHYEKDFAPLMDPLNFENCFLYIDSTTNKVAAHLAVCPRIVVKNNCEMSIALIGGIATRKEHRGQSLFKSLMETAIKYHEDRVGLFVLWSDLENLYEKFDFHRTGGFFETGKRNFSSTERPSGYEKTKFSQLEEKDLKRIISLYSTFNEQYFFTIRREEKDWSIIREMDSVDLYIKRNTSGDIERYFCVNKGRDLTNIIHEVSCLNDKEFPKMIRELEQFKTWLPEGEIKTKLSAEIFYTAFMRLGSLDLINKFLKEVTGDLLKIETKQLIFTFQDKTFEASQKDFLQFLFGPKPLQEFGPFGLSLYVAGTDSV